MPVQSGEISVGFSHIFLGAFSCFTQRKPAQWVWVLTTVSGAGVQSAQSRFGLRQLQRLRYRAASVNPRRPSQTNVTSSLPNTSGRNGTYPRKGILCLPRKSGISNGRLTDLTLYAARSTARSSAQCANILAGSECFSPMSRKNFPSHSRQREPQRDNLLVFVPKSSKSRESIIFA